MDKCKTCGEELRVAEVVFCKTCNQNLREAPPVVVPPVTKTKVKAAAPPAKVTAKRR